MSQQENASIKNELQIARTQLIENDDLIKQLKRQLVIG